MSNKLFQSKLTIKNTESCLGRVSLNYCALDTSNRVANICYGDLGGPMAYYLNGKFYLYGLYSYTMFIPNQAKICHSKNPLFFTILPNYLNWIKDNISKEYF